MLVATMQPNSVVMNRMWARAEIARSESETAYFFDLLYLGEMVTKLTVCELLATVDDERDRHKYRLEHRLVRASGIGEWVAVLDELLIGPASQHSIREASRLKREVTETFGATDESWQRTVVNSMSRAMTLCGLESTAGRNKVALRSWFADFATLRNRTRGHGAAPPAKCEAVAAELEASLRVMTQSLGFLLADCAFLKRNLSGKYRVTPVTQLSARLISLKSEATTSLLDGFYIDLDGTLRRVPLVESDSDLSDFFFPNGAFREAAERHASYEVLSYHSDTTKASDGTRYLEPPTVLPESETAARPNLDTLGMSFSNIPPKTPDYVSRPGLERELLEVLRDTRHPVVTMVGRGGIGKTSLALEGLHAIAQSGEFFAIIWFSARDIDLLHSGPKIVRPGVISKEDIAASLHDLLQPPGAAISKASSVDYLTKVLGGQEVSGPILFVFDNFETVNNPVELYTFLDTYIRLPNKVLLTSRIREFKGDYPVEVKGMTRDEFDEMVDSWIIKLGISSLATSSYRDSLFDESDGHPYIAKVLLGELARTRVAGSVERIMASRDEILTALFERTYDSLSPAAQRVFLTAASWRSPVPRVALEAVLSRSRNERMDVAKAVESLEQASLIELIPGSDEGNEFVRVPLAAYLFAQGKLRVSEIRDDILQDSEILKMLGASGRSGSSLSLDRRVRQMVKEVAKTPSPSSHSREEELSVVEFIARKYPPAWMLLSELHSEEGNLARAIKAAQSFLENVEDDRAGWRWLAELAKRADESELELHARLRVAAISGATVWDLSSAAVVASRHFSQNALSPDQRRARVGDLAEHLEEFRDELSATDLSRLAWLYLNTGRESQARSCVHDGLEREPTNRHCNQLAEKLGLFSHEI
jgi:tetratricopeptide (TPR) repeat protein